ncbi:PE-PPE domain-containing protein [Mycolicibacterium sp. ND9-15]|uniref:PE-PPE domain-containing protein n=1 Tax=Mycolicibacterium sp. ND9-15 TaxID=3042320 RepID=UPI002DDC3206|nr:PE-PPE domain-containing protein [Mycolicibacterium sp. ND9-15]WSE55103.1 PE-PPE domain-containing protein [Mycolicibacterium sp. ND9-15]
MKAALRSLGAMCLAVLAAVALAVAWTTATAVQLAASALIMGGTDHPLSTPPDDPFYINQYLSNAVTAFINPAADAPTAGSDPIDGVDRNVYAVVYPAQFFPVFGSKTFDTSIREGVGSLDGCVHGSASCVYNSDASYNVDPTQPTPPPAAGEDYVIFGYSQSAVVASLVKRSLIADPRDEGQTSFFLLANPMRPNGGILARGLEGFTIPILGVTFYGATPTNSCEGEGPCMPTVDVAAQYDGLGGDAPASLTNVLAILNAAAGYYYLHGELQNADFAGAKYQGHYGDTDYYLYPTKRLPILMPFDGIVPSPILTLLDAPLRVLIEGAYARDVNPGVATKVGLLPFRNPIKTAINLVKSVPTGVDDALAEVAHDPDFRPLGTKPTTSPFGVGGPDLPPPPAEQDASRMSMRSSPGDDDLIGETITDGEVGSSADPLAENVSGDKPLRGVENPTTPGNKEETGDEDVVEDTVGQAGDENAEDDVLNGKPQRVGAKPGQAKPGQVRPAQVKPALPKSPKLPKLRGPIKFDSPSRMGPSPAGRADQNVTGGAEQVSKPDDSPGDPAGGSEGEAPAAA